MIIIHGNPTTYCYFTGSTGSTETLRNSNRIVAGKIIRNQYYFTRAVRNFEGERQINGIEKEGTVGTACVSTIGMDKVKTLSISWECVGEWLDIHGG